MDLNQKINDFRTLFWMGYENDDFAKIVISPRRNTIFSGLEVQKITEIVYAFAPCQGRLVTGGKGILSWVILCTGELLTTCTG